MSSEEGGKLRTFKILSIDGGGIKGLYSSVILKVLEKHYGPIGDYFDLICGTSTGGLIAMGLAVDKPASEIERFYRTEGPRIFNSHSWFKRKLLNAKQFCFSSKYSDETLRTVLYDFFGEKILNDAKCCLCIPAVNLTNFQGVVFKTSHHAGLVRDGNLTMVEVCLATSAAPTFFPIAKISGVSNLLVDGGIWANNPTFVGAIEAVSYFVGKDKEYDNFDVLSISNLATQNGWSPTKPRNSSLRHWKDDLVDLTMSVQSKVMHNLLKIAFEKEFLPVRNYIRIPDPELKPTQIKVLELDRADKKAIDTISDLAYSKVYDCVNNPEIKEVFRSKVKQREFPIK